MDKTRALCGSEHIIILHHLIPKSCHRNKWVCKYLDKDDLVESDTDICRRCILSCMKTFWKSCWAVN